MNGRFLVIGALFWVAASCGGNVEQTWYGPGPGSGGSSASGGRGGGGALFDGGAGKGGGTAGKGGAGPSAGGTGVVDAGFDHYVDPGCPDAAAPPGIVECDPLAPISGCAPGYGCYPYVEHPFGSGCGQQTYGALCLSPGIGQQGAPCSSDSPIGDHCAPGYVCVIGILPGKRCAKLCPLGTPDVCPDGMICGDLDIEGYGVCG